MTGYKRVNFYELCRLCATNQQKDKTHIFQEEGRKIQLQTKIQSCLSLTVCENDFLPKVVCSKCLRSLEVCYFFRQECVTSESMLSSYFKNFRYTEDFKKSGKVYIKDTSSKCTLIPQHSNLQQNEVVTSSTTNHNNNNYNGQLDAKTINDNLPFYTLQLPAGSIQIDSKNQHHLAAAPTTTTHTTTPGGGGGGVKIETNKILANQAQIAYNLNTINLATIKTNNSNTKICSSNNNNNSNENNVIVNANGEVINVAQFLDFESIINHHTNNLQQQQQLKITKKPTNRSRQLVKEENVDGIIKIDLTNSSNDFDTGQVRSKAKFYPTTTIKMEEKNTNPTVIFNNTIADFNNYNNFNNTGNGLFQQQTASTTTPSTSSVAAVATSAATPAIVAANLEQQSTVNLNVLNSDFNQIRTNQMKISNNAITTTTEQQSQSQQQVLKTHVCDICQKSFKRREHLYQHVKLHTGFRPYSCDNCNKSFMRKEHLLRHQTSHSGQKNFTCNICDKSFSRNDNLLKHKKTHDKQSSYSCEICQKQFVMKHYYLAHKLIHDNNNVDNNKCNNTNSNSTSNNNNNNNVWSVLKT